MTTRSDYRDALAWAYAVVRKDWDGRNRLATMVDPAGLVDAITDMWLGLASITTHGHPTRYLDEMRANLDDLLDRYEMEDE